MRRPARGRLRRGDVLVQKLPVDNGYRQRGSQILAQGDTIGRIAHMRWALLWLDSLCGGGLTEGLSEAGWVVSPRMSE